MIQGSAIVLMLLLGAPEAKKKAFEATFKVQPTKSNSVGSRGPSYRPKNENNADSEMTKEGVVACIPEKDGSDSCTGIIPFRPPPPKNAKGVKDERACPPYLPQMRLQKPEKAK